MNSIDIIKQKINNSPPLMKGGRGVVVFLSSFASFEHDMAVTSDRVFQFFFKVKFSHVGSQTLYNFTILTKMLVNYGQTAGLN